MYKLLIILLISNFVCKATACTNEDALKLLANYQWITEDYPPYNFKDQQGNITGIFPDVLAKIYQELSIPFVQNNVAVVPWARLYYTMENDRSSAAFSMVKTAERDKLFMLIPLPNKTKVSIMVLAKNLSKFKTKPLSELEIAVVREDIGQQLLNTRKILAKQKETTSALSMINMLIHERVDAIAYAEEVAYFQDKKLGLEHDEIVPMYNLENQSQNAFVFHKDTPTCVSDTFYQVIDSLEEQGKLEFIWAKYTN